MPGLFWTASVEFYECVRVSGPVPGTCRTVSAGRVCVMNVCVSE